jgi:hypothetical protein
VNLSMSLIVTVFRPVLCSGDVRFCMCLSDEFESLNSGMCPVCDLCRVRSLVFVLVQLTVGGLSAYCRSVFVRFFSFVAVFMFGVMISVIQVSEVLCCV